MTNPEKAPKEGEGGFHNYITNKIPWFVHLLWILFWIFAVGYVLIWLVPALQREILSPQ